MLYAGADPDSYITEYTLVYEDKPCELFPSRSVAVGLASLVSPGSSSLQTWRSCAVQHTQHSYLRKAWQSGGLVFKAIDFRVTQLQA